MKSSRGFAIIELLIIIIIFSFVSLIGFFIWQDRAEQTSSPTPTPIEPAVTLAPTSTPEPPTVTPTPGDAYSEDTGVLNQKRYTSPKLGISFLYLTKHLNENFNVQEDGNKIYIYGDQGIVGSGNYLEGQYLEVLNKSANLTLQQALESVITNGYSLNNCTATENGTQTYNNQTYTTGNIDVVGNPQDIEALDTLLQNCPTPYTRSNGISYFLYNPNVPTKYLFLSIGQYGIMADEQSDLSWQDTITISN